MIAILQIFGRLIAGHGDGQEFPCSIFSAVGTAPDTLTVIEDPGGHIHVLDPEVPVLVAVPGDVGLCLDGGGDPDWHGTVAVAGGGVAQSRVVLGHALDHVANIDFNVLDGEGLDFHGVNAQQEHAQQEGGFHQQFGGHVW